MNAQIISSNLSIEAVSLGRRSLGRIVRIASVGIGLLALALFVTPKVALAATCTSNATGTTWSSTTHWSGCGGLVPQNGDIVIIATATTLDTNSNSIASLTVNTGQTLTIGNNGTGRTLTATGNVTLTGTGTIIAGATAATHSMLIGGNLSNAGTFNCLPGAGRIINITFNGAAQSVSGAGTTTFNNITINNGATVTFATSATMTAVTVGQGTSGVLTFDSAASRTLTITGSVIVNAGAQFITQAAGTQTHIVNLAGNLTNSGTFDMSRGGATLLADVTFNGSANQTVSGSGGTTRFNNITVNNSVAASIININTSNFAAASGFLTLTQGIFELSGTFGSFSNSFFNTGAYTIPANSGLWINNANVTVTGQNADATVNGLLRISQGTYNVGTVGDNDLDYGTGSTIDIQGGALNITGAFQGTNVVAGGSTDTTTYIQSAGTVTTATVDVSSDVTTGGKSFASFDIKAAGSSFTMSGGTIVMQNPTNVQDDYVVGATLGSVTGGTLQAGNSSTTITNPYAITSSTPVFNLTIKDTVSTFAELLNSPLIVKGNVLIEAGATFNTLSLDLSVAGNWTNDGAYISGAQTTTFNGSAAQTIGGTVSTAFSSLTINNGAGVSLNTSGSVSGVLTLTTDLTVNEAQATPALLTQSGTSAGTGDVIGTVRRTDLAGAAQRDFGNPNVEITIVTGTITTMDVGLTKGSAPSGFAAAVQRVYSLQPGAGTLTSATVKLHYLDSELNSNLAANLTLWRAVGSPSSTWTDQGAAGVTRQTGANPNNWIQKTAVAAFSAWALASGPPSAPTAVKLNRFNAQGFSDGVSLSWESGFEVDNLGYHIYREQNGARSRVTPSVVAGSALQVGPGSLLAAGYSYSWFDQQGTSNTGYYLESIDLNGARETVGTIYPQGSKGISPKGHRALLLNELNATARALNGTQLSERSWATALPASARSQTIRLRPESLVDQHVIAAGPAVKIHVRRSGWYRLTQAELVAAGLDVSRDARLLQMYVDGEEIPIRLSGDGSHLGPNDSIEFYGVPLDTPSTDTRTYWLIAGDNPGRRISLKHSKVKPGDQMWTESATANGSFLYTTEVKEKISHFPNLLNGDAENIFGPLVTTDPVTETVQIKSFDRQARATARLAVALQGATVDGHAVEVQLNGVVLGTITFSGRQHLVTNFEVDRALLQDSDNTLRFTAANGDTDILFVDWVRLTYPRKYRAEANALQFSVPGGQTVRVVGFTTPNIRVVDITDPNSVSEMDVSAGPVGAGYGVKLQVKGFDTRTLLAFADDVVEQAASVVANQPSSWNASSNGADMVIVTHKDFREAIEPLAVQRRGEGLNVAVVDIEDVYDEFGYGAHSPLAVKGFLAWAASHWSRAPQYLLLVGDSSFDPRNYLDQGANDFVPTKLLDTAYMETASDDWLADFNGDNLADMAVGRLPGRTAADVSLMVAKILSYERERELGAPLRGALMVADNGFELESSQTSALLPPDLTVQSINRSEVGNDDLARGQIVNALNQGPSVVNYYGHGSVEVWTGAGLLDSTLAEGLTNTDRLSLFVMMTCLNGYAHDAYIDSLAESVLKAQHGGAVAVWASSGFTEPLPQFVLGSEFYRQLFGTQSLRLGQATRNAKAATTDLDVRQTWILLGDPTMRIR